MRKKLKHIIHNYCCFSKRDTIFTVAVFAITSLFCTFIHYLDIVDNMIVIAMSYVLGITFISRFTTGYFYGILSSIIAVICDNYIFTYPYFNLNFSMPSYPISFLSMFTVSLVICTMTAQLKEKEAIMIMAKTEKMRSNLLSAVSHDLRTPLTTIIGSTTAILENYEMLSREERVHLLTEVREESEWLIRMVENLLFITRMQNSSTNLSKREEIAEEIIFEAVTKLKKRYPDAPIHITVPEEIFIVPMDAMLIEQVILNLIENSIRHGETVTNILISVDKEDDFAVFKIIDNGVGIAPSIFPHLFDELARTSKDDRMDTKKDMGIGLSVCMSIIQAHHGTMEASNNKEGGATFIFRLPLKEES